MPFFLAVLLIFLAAPGSAQAEPPADSQERLQLSSGDGDGLHVSESPSLEPSQPGHPESLSLREVIRDVRASNRDLDALDESRRAILERAVAAGSMPHPSVGFAVKNLPVPSFSFTDDMMTMTEVMVWQRFPWFGKRALRREAEGLGATEVEAQAGALGLALEEAAVGAYANLWLAVSSRAVVLEQQQALERFAQLARNRYAAGGGNQSDVFRAEVELVRIREPLVALDELESNARAALAALMARESGLLPGSPEPIPLPAFPEDSSSWLAKIPAHPELEAIRQQEQRSVLDEKLALRDRWPDPEVGLMYGVRAEGEDMIGVEVMFHLPVFASSKEDRLAAASRAEARSAASRREARQSGLVAEARAAFASAATQRELMRLYDDDLLPRASRSLESAGAAYRAGRVDFLTLLDARVQLQSQQIEALRTRAGYLREFARWQRAVGVSFLTRDQE